MFDISNKIAYADSMYAATQVPEKINVKFETQFIDCEGMVEKKHFVKKQADVIIRILLSEIDFVQGLPDLFIISPFSEVSYRLRELLFDILTSAVQKKAIKGDNKSINDWIKTHVSTVHTFQGKEAEGVILCLGLDENTSTSADWASKTPNLLNVVLTRAKYRFIAIGDADIWLQKPYFEELHRLSEKHY